MTASEALMQARRHLRAAGALYREGLVPECHAEMRAALTSTLAAWTPNDSAPAARVAAAPPSAAIEDPALGELAKRGYDVARLRAALSIGADGLPDDRRMPARFEALWAEAERLVRFSTKALRAPPEIRRRRFLATGALVLALLVTLFVSFRLWGRVRARASATYSPEWPASYAVDGLDATEWILPDKTLGWLDVYLPRPTDVKRVVVLNGHNRFYLDRATKGFKVTAFAGNHELASAEAEFPGIKDGRSAREVKLRADGVTRLRIEILSYFGAGGTIAEVEVR